MSKDQLIFYRKGDDGSWAQKNDPTDSFSVEDTDDGPQGVGIFRKGVWQVKHRAVMAVLFEGSNTFCVDPKRKKKLIEFPLEREKRLKCCLTLKDGRHRRPIQYKELHVQKAVGEVHTVSSRLLCLV